MRWFVTAAVAVSILQGPALAQGGPNVSAIAAQQEAMNKLAFLRGQWRGPAVAQARDREERMTQTERVGTVLDGTMTVVEGRGYLANGRTSFHALGLISFDPATGKYWLDTHAQGQSGKYEMKLTPTGFTWEFPAGPGVMRFTATVDGKSWNETGEFVMAGRPARRTVTMTLSRIGDTNWPEEGAVPPK